jgi:hypothetical protein
MSAHGGMLGAVTEAIEIHRSTGCTVEEAFAEQRRLWDERHAPAEPAEPEPSNVIQFRPRGF